MTYLSTGKLHLWFKRLGCRQWVLMFYGFLEFINKQASNNCFWEKSASSRPFPLSRNVWVCNRHIAMCSTWPAMKLIFLLAINFCLIFSIFTRIAIPRLHTFLTEKLINRMSWNVIWWRPVSCIYFTIFWFLTIVLPNFTNKTGLNGDRKNQKSTNIHKSWPSRSRFSV